MTETTPYRAGGTAPDPSPVTRPSTSESGRTSSPVKMTRRLVVTIYATEAEADAVRDDFERVGVHVNASAMYHHQHSAPCCVQAPASIWPESAPARTPTGKGSQEHIHFGWVECNNPACNAPSGMGT